MSCFGTWLTMGHKLRLTKGELPAWQFQDPYTVCESASKSPRFSLKTCCHSLTKQIFLTHPAAFVQLSVKLSLVRVHICHISQMKSSETLQRETMEQILRGNKGHNQQRKAAPTKQLPHVQPHLLWGDRAFLACFSVRTGRTHQLYLSWKEREGKLPISSISAEFSSCSWTQLCNFEDNKNILNSFKRHHLLAERFAVLLLMHGCKQTNFLINEDPKAVGKFQYAPYALDQDLIRFKCFNFSFKVLIFRTQRQNCYIGTLERQGWNMGVLDVERQHRLLKTSTHTHREVFTMEKISTDILHYYFLCSFEIGLMLLRIQ